jgi:hypothetical protein
MKRCIFSLALALISCITAYSENVLWINTGGGNWSDSGSWNPPHVPISGDNAIITNTGNYTVALDISPTVDSLVLGGSSGTQTLATAGQNLTLNNPGSVVNQHGVLHWAGAAINGNLNIAAYGMLIVSGAASYDDLHGVLTNAGTILLTNSTNLRCYGDIGGGQLINLSGALVDFKDDSLIYYAGYPGEAVFNQGTLRKSGHWRQLHLSRVLQ